jgi:cell shape-determining protein MreC
METKRRITYQYSAGIGVRTKGRVRRRLYILAILLIVLFGALTFFDFGPPSLFVSGTHTLSRPLWSVRQVLFSVPQILSDSFAIKKNLAKENSTLRDKIAELERLNTAQSSEIQRLLQRTEIAPLRPEHSYIAVEIVQKPPISALDTYLVDAGWADGVRKGDSAWSARGSVLGDVVDVYKHSATIRLHSFPTQETDALLDLNDSLPSVATSSIRGSLQIKLIGRGGGNFVAQIPRDMPVEKGASVFLSGHEKILLGNVYAIQSKPTDPYAELLIRYTENIEIERWIFLTHRIGPEEEPLLSKEGIFSIDKNKVP